jgi:hypothetical protein
VRPVHVVGFRRPSAESGLHDRAKYRRYGIIVGIEFASAGIGAAILGVPPSTITGIGAGLFLLGYAVRALARAVRN